MTLAQAINKAVLQRLVQIQRARKPTCEKLEELDALKLRVISNHPDGLAANVINNISDLETQIMYPNRISKEN